MNIFQKQNNKLTNYFFISFMLFFLAKPVVVYSNNGTESLFSANEIQIAIKDALPFLLNPYPDKGIFLEDKDQNSQENQITAEEVYGALGDLISIQEADIFNEVILNLLAEYRQVPANRQVIQQLIMTIHNKSLSQINANNSKHALVTVIDDIFLMASIAYTFGIAKGVWSARSSGLKGIERFKNIITSVSTNLPRSKIAHLKILGIGSTVGLSHAIINYFQTQKRSPRELLYKIQIELLTEYKKKVFWIEENSERLIKSYADNQKNNDTLSPQNVTETSIPEDLFPIETTHKLPQSRTSLESLCSCLSEELAMLQYLAPSLGGQISALLNKLEAIEIQIQ